MTKKKRSILSIYVVKLIIMKNLLSTIVLIFCMSYGFSQGSGIAIVNNSASPIEVVIWESASCAGGTPILTGIIPVGGVYQTSMITPGNIYKGVEVISGGSGGYGNPDYCPGSTLSGISATWYGCPTCSPIIEFF